MKPPGWVLEIGKYKIVAEIDKRLKRTRKI